MPFILPELSVESIIRDGLENARRDPTIIDDVFAEFTKPHLQEKYGDGEIRKIKKIIQERAIQVVHSFPGADPKISFISIQASDDAEDQAKSYMGDGAGSLSYPITDPDQLAKYVVLSNVEVTSYDAASKRVSVPDATALEKIYANLILESPTGEEVRVTGGIRNTAGQKGFSVSGPVTPGTNFKIRQDIQEDFYTERANAETVRLILTVQTGQPLLTRYLYVLLKYILLSRKDDLCSRGVLNPTYAGSDFNRNMDYGGDTVYRRFLSMTGMVVETWRAEKVVLVDNLDLNVVVAADEFGNKALDLEDQGIQTDKP